MPARVHVLGTGGTIASTGGDDGAAPSLDAGDLVEAAPAIEDHADVTVEEVDRRPGFDMQPDTVLDAAASARAAIDDGADGVVVTHGTDTLEETAYALDLLLDAVPVVVTGAQRRPDEVSADGPANLLAAVRAAAHPRVTHGVFVAFDEELHAARDVTKAHTSKLGTFTSPNTGPVAAVTRGPIRFHREPASESVTLPDAAFGPRVEIVASGLGADAAPIHRALDAGVDGLVVAGTGLGNTTTALADGVRESLDSGVPVVVASRCHAGATAAVYGTPGGGHTLTEHGAIHAGTRPPHKARLLLSLALGAGHDPDAIAALFDTRTQQ